MAITREQRFLKAQVEMRKELAVEFVEEREVLSYCVWILAM